MNFLRGIFAIFLWIVAYLIFKNGVVFLGLPNTLPSDEAYVFMITVALAPFLLGSVILMGLWRMPQTSFVNTLFYLDLLICLILYLRLS